MGRERKPRNKRNSPPADESWIWMTRRMIESDAFRALGINARRVLDFVILDHMAHAGTENGRLCAPYSQLVLFGVAKSEICSAITELETFGFIEVTKGQRLGGRQQASRYRLTWLSSADGEPATNRWRSVTVAFIRAYREERRRRATLQKERKRQQRAVRDKKPAPGAGILKAVREVEPSSVREVEPAEAFSGSESRTGVVRKVGARGDF